MNELELKKIYRICDANLNRAKEGLRVVEDYLRFYKEDDGLMKNIRDIRHILGKVVDEDLQNKLLAERDISKDSGVNIQEEAKDDLQKIIRANIKRAQEALRVLEEYSKIIAKQKFAVFKELRFKLYDLEKDIFIK